MDSTFVVAQIATTTGEIADSLTGGLPLILTIVAALIGLGMLIRYIKKWIGRKA